MTARGLVAQMAMVSTHAAATNASLWLTRYEDALGRPPRRAENLQDFARKRGDHVPIAAARDVMAGTASLWLTRYQTAVGRPPRRAENLRAFAQRRGGRIP